jgi:hypothetical protein
MSKFIEDDAEEMVEIIQTVFKDLVEEYMITASESENIMKKLESNLDGKILKLMYASSDRKQFAYNLLIELFLIEVKNRKKIHLPEEKQFTKVLGRNLELMSDFESKIDLWKKNHVNAETEQMCIIDPRRSHEIFSEIKLLQTQKPYVIFGTLDKNTKVLKRHSYVEITV